MAPRKSPNKVLNDGAAGAENSTPPISDSAPLTKRDGEKARHVSVKQASVLTGRDRNTIQRYIDEGMEVVQRADRDRGIPWVIDLAVMLRFCEERAARNVAERAGGSDGKMTEDEAKRRRAVAQAFTAELEYAETAKIVARIHEMLDLVRKDYSEISLRLKAIPESIAARVDEKFAEKVRKVAHELIDQALKGLVADKEIEKRA